MKKKAFDRFCEKVANNQRQHWLNVLTGNSIFNVDEEDICDLGVKTNTFRKQAREQGFYTKDEGCWISLSRTAFKYMD